MQDRVSANPGRVLITPEDGSGAFYATLAMADNPTVEGTALNKANLLSDATAALYGLGADAVPNDAFALIASESVKLKTLNSYQFDANSASKIVAIPLKELTYNKRQFVCVSTSADYVPSTNFTRIYFNGVDNAAPYTYGNRVILNLVSGLISVNQYASGKWTQGVLFFEIQKTSRLGLRPHQFFYTINWVNENELMYLYGFTQTEGSNPELVLSIEQEILGGSISVILYEEA